MDGIITSSVEPPVVVALVDGGLLADVPKNFKPQHSCQQRNQGGGTTILHVVVDSPPNETISLFSCFHISLHLHIHILVSLDFFFKPAIFKGACHEMLNVVGHDEN